MQLTKERNVELAMKEVPKQVKEIRRTAVAEVFKSDIENMDPETRAYSIGFWVMLKKIH